MDLESIKKYIFYNYGIEFKNDIYAFSPAISFIDKKKKQECNIHLSEFYDKSSKYIGYDIHNIPYSHGFSGPVAYKEKNINDFYKKLDYIMQDIFEYQKVSEKQLTLFDT